MKPSCSYREQRWCEVIDNEADLVATFVNEHDAWLWRPSDEHREVT